MNNSVNNENVKLVNPFTFLKVLYKNMILIILITVFCGLCGTVYSVLKVKPVYTATRAVIFKTSVKLDEVAPTVKGSVTLAKMYLHQVETTLRAPNVINSASKEYNKEAEKNKNLSKGKLSSGAVGISYGDDSLIFNISYSAASFKEAEAKLDALIKAADVDLNTTIKSSGVSLVDVQNRANQSVSSSFYKYVIFSIIIGAVLAVAIVALKHALDNTIKSKSEFEQMTGLNVIAVIDKISDK
jgi:capsular polysaccharide biosynthesis protein